MLTHQGDYDIILPTRDGWISCPACRRNRRLHRVDPNEEAERIGLFCRDCKRTIWVKIHKGQCFESRSQHSA